MTVEITGVTITEEKVTIEAINLETILLAEDLFAEITEEPTVTFEFDRKERNGAEMKYLWRVVQGQRKTQSAKSFGEKLEKLCGAITQLSASFLQQQQ